MKERRFTIDRRTFIKTASGLVIMNTFVGRYSQAHAANPPQSFEFKASVGRWLAIGQSGALDTAQSGQITVTPAGGSATVYPIENGGFSFSIPNNVPSEILLEVYGMSSRSWGADFDTGTLRIKNHDYNETPLVYHWLEEENAYYLEYWQDSLYVTGPADPGGYFIGWLYQPLDPLVTSGRLPLAGKSALVAPRTKDGDHDPPPTNPPEQGSDTGTNGIIGINGNNNGVSIGSELAVVAMLLLVTGTICLCCAALEGVEPDPELQPMDTVVSDEIRIPIIPSLAALEQNGPERRLENLDFGAVIHLQDPAGNDLGGVFVGLNQEVEIAGGVKVTLTHLLSYPIDQIVITSKWPSELLAGAERGVYKITFWAQTVGGLSSNKRFEYCRVQD